MERISRNCIKRIAVRQWKNNFPLWLAGTLSSALLVCVSVCWALQEKGWHISLILCSTCIVLFLIGRKTVCPDGFAREVLETVGATEEQIKKIMMYQMTWMYLTAVPIGVCAGLLVKPILQGY